MPVTLLRFALCALMVIRDADIKLAP